MNGPRRPADGSDRRDIAGRRHSWLHRLARALSVIIAGQHAEHLQRADLPESGVLVDLPDWLWSHPLIDTGRKACGAGGALLLPVQVAHDPGPLLLVPAGAAVQVRWRANGLGIDLAGHLHVTCAADGQPRSPRRPDAPDDGFDPAVAALTADPMPRRHLRAQLNRLARDGKAARWQVLGDLEPMVRSAVRTAHASLSLELSDGRVRLDDTELQTVTDRIILGHGDSADSPVIRLLDRLITPGQVTNVDLLHHIRRTLRRDAGDVLRSHIADPRVGPAVRRFARDAGISDPAALLAAYRLAHPNARLGPDRLVRCLATPMRMRDAMTLTGGRPEHDRADICGNPIDGHGRAAS